MKTGTQASSDRGERLDCQFCVEELQTLLAAQQAIASSLEPNLVVQLLADEARRLISAEMSAVYLFKKKHLEIFAVSGGFRKSLLGHSVPVGDSIAGKVVECGQPMLVEDTHQAGCNYSPVVERFTVRSVLAVPLRIKQRTIGTVLVANRSLRNFSPDSVCFLELLAAGAAVAIENARRYIYAQQSAALEERHRLERKLQGSVSQPLFSASLIADILPRLWDLNPLEGRSRMEELRQITRGVLVEVRRLLMDDQMP